MTTIRKSTIFFTRGAIRGLPEFGRRFAKISNDLDIDNIDQYQRNQILEKGIDHEAVHPSIPLERRRRRIRDRVFSRSEATL